VVILSLAPLFYDKRCKGSHMDMCPVCNHPILETVLEAPKRIGAAAAVPDAPTGIGRFLTISSLLCECGERIERLYENRPLAPFGQ
jgi:hypothetical protein